MASLSDQPHDAVHCPSTKLLAEILWHLLKAHQMMEAQCYLRTERGIFEKIDRTEFGHEVGRDEIHWWIFTKEDDLDILRTRSELALSAADRLKANATKMKVWHPPSFEALLTRLRHFAEAHEADIEEIHSYLKWLHGRNALAPSILFTYRVWGSTRRSDRSIEITGLSTDDADESTLRTLAEIALGLQRGRGLPSHTRALYEIAEDIYSNDPERAVVELDLTDDRVVARASAYTLDEFSVFLEEIRDSLRNVLLDIEKCVAQRNVMNSDSFWRSFILAAIRVQTQEPQHWDFKETLTIWHAKGDARNAAAVAFAEDVASFANSEGGVLIVGVSDRREILGIGSGAELESRLKFARDVLAKRLEYQREIVSFHQIAVPDRRGAERVCLVVVVARTCAAVSVGDGAGRFTYPVRRETGVSRESRSDITHRKIHAKSDDHDFMERLIEFLKESKP